MSLVASLRQLLQPKEFRIGASAWPTDLLNAVERIAGATSSPPTVVGRDGQERLLADIGTSLWRLRQKLIDPATGEPLGELRRPYRHLESIWDTLLEAGIEIQDHTDDLYEGGMSLKVLAFEPQIGLQQERVAETIKPSIYLHGKQIQMGEVIVARPERSRAAGS